MLLSDMLTLRELWDNEAIIHEGIPHNRWQRSSGDDSTVKTPGVELAGELKDRVRDKKLMVTMSYLEI